MLKKVLLYGFLIWAVPFAVAFLIFGIRETNRPLFESIMPVTVTLSVVFFANCYFKKLKTDYLNEGIKLGVAWLTISLLIDFLMFMQGPMKMAFGEYMADIGITYLIIPIITIGFGYLLERKNPEPA